MLARMSETQKLKQKSQLNNSEINLVPLSITKSRIPDLPKNKIAKDAISAMLITSIKNDTILYISDIVLLLLR